MGFTISPQSISQGLYLADKDFYEENARIPIRQRNPEEQTRAYSHYQEIVLREAGVTATKDLVRALMTRMRQLNAGMKFVLYDDVLATLKTLKEKNLTIGLLTNLQREIDSMCRELGIASYIDFTVTSGEVGADKPQAPIFLKALELAKVKPAEAIHIGDQYQNDCIGARGVGINPVLLDRASLQTAISDCPRIASLTEIVRYIS